MFMELGKEVVRKIRAELSRQSRDGADDDVEKVKLEASGGASAASSSCC